MNELDKLIVRLAAVITGLEQRFIADQQKIISLEQQLKEFETFCESVAEPVPTPPPSKKAA